MNGRKVGTDTKEEKGDRPKKEMWANVDGTNDQRFNGKGQTTEGAKKGHKEVGQTKIKSTYC